jgi:hypothetical protein
VTDARPAIPNRNWAATPCNRALRLYVIARLISAGAMPVYTPSGINQSMKWLDENVRRIRVRRMDLPLYGSDITGI